MVAKDGKPFDEPNELLIQREDEVEVIQYLKPSGRRRRMLAPVGKEHAEMAKDMVLSSEILSTGEVALYAYFQDEDEEEYGAIDLAENGPGDKNPTAVLQRMIEKKFQERLDTTTDDT